MATNQVLKDIVTVAQFPWVGINALKEGRGAKSDLHWQIGTWEGDGVTPVAQESLNGNLPRTACVITAEYLAAKEASLKAEKEAFAKAEAKRAEIRKAQEAKLAAKSEAIREENRAQVSEEGVSDLLAMMQAYADLPKKVREACTPSTFKLIFEQYRTLPANKRESMPLAKFTEQAVAFLSQAS